MFKQHTLKVPIELLQMVNACKLHKALGIFLLLKSYCDGHLILTKDLQTEMMLRMGIRTITSFSKYLDRLIQLNWVGRDHSNNTYYIRSFNWLRKVHQFTYTTSAVFNLTKDIRHITEFVQAAIIGFEVRRRESGRKAKIIKVAGRSALKKASALQELTATGVISAYIGISNEQLGKLLGVSKSQADRIKKRLVSLGLLSTRPRYKLIAQSSKPDFKLIKHYNPNRRYRISRIRHKGKLSYRFKERTYDEIMNHIEFVNQRNLLKRLNQKGLYKVCTLSIPLL